MNELPERRIRASRVSPYVVVLVYLAAGLAWILWSDSLIEPFSPLQSVKGAAFVLVTAAILLILLTRRQRQLEAVEDELHAIVAEKIAANEALRTSESLLRTVVDTAAEGLCLIDANDRTLFLNPRLRALVAVHDDALGRPALELVAPGSRTAFGALLEDCRRGLTARATVMLASPAGAGVTCEVSCAPLTGQDASYSGCVAMFTDVTERLTGERDRVQLRLQVEDSNRLGGLARLASGVAHEFNNVLMGIQPFVEIIRRRSPGDEKITSAIDSIGRAIHRGKRITHELSGFSRAEPASHKSLALDGWLDTQRTELEAGAGAGIRVSLTVATPGLEIAADPDQIRLVLMHLAANARDAMPDGGDLSIVADRPAPGTAYPFGVVPTPERFAHLRVTDTGRGIPADLLPTIFEPLFTTKGRESTGLGLAISHQIVTSHQGYFFAESAAGQGTTIHVFLPLSAASQS